MSRLAIAFVLALAATAANAQDTKSEQSQTPAVASAIEDALRPLGVRIDTLPVTPSRLRALIREAEPRKGTVR